MKKIFCLLVVFCSFLLCSCDVPQGMRELLAYQGGDFACEAVLSGEKPIALTISRVGDDIIIKPDGTEYIGDAAFVFDEEGAWICSGETRIKLEKTQLQRLCTVYEMFTLDAAKAWRITEEKARRHRDIQMRKRRQYGIYRCQYPPAAQIFGRRRGA